MGGGAKVDRIAEQLREFQRQLADPSTSPADAKILEKQVAQWLALDQDKLVAAAEHGYRDDDKVYGAGRVRTALEELIRWRLWDRTGGGLMAELGSHQLDAASIFVSALSKEVGKKVHPLTVHAIGGRHL